MKEGRDPTRPLKKGEPLPGSIDDWRRRIDTEIAKLRGRRHDTITDDERKELKAACRAVACYFDPPAR